MTINRSTLRWITVILMWAATLAQPARAAGLMTPADGSLPELGIREHHVDVVIEDGYAVTAVDQVFYNPSDLLLEAIYSFPVPERASVGEFTYWIDGKAVTGEVLEKARAAEVYEQEKAQGREAALTGQDDYRVFESRVYPVPAQGSVRIRLVYLQPVEVDLGIGRYVYPLEEGGVDEEKLAFWRFNDQVDAAFSFNLRMRSSYPVASFRLPHHPQAAVVKESDQRWRVTLGDRRSDDAQSEDNVAPGGAVASLDRDVVVYWRHQQGLPGSVDMVSHRRDGSERGTFMLTITPGDDLQGIQQGRDWVFVLDYSGSMQGKYHSLVEGVKKGLGKLGQGDRFRVVLFNNGAREVTSGYLEVNERNIRWIVERLENTQPTGGTNLYAGLDLGYRGLDTDRPSAVVLVTDGVANVGVTQKKAFLDLLQKHDVRLFAFVMGNSANRPLLQSMTRVSNGFSMNISNSDDIGGRLIQAADKLRHEAYRDIEVKFDGVKVRDLAPARPGSLYRGQQLIVFGHYWGSGPAEVEITGRVSDREVAYRTGFDFPARSELNPELERLWAFAQIRALQDRIDYLGEESDTRQGIVDLALEYGLVTDYTSMVVLREEVYAQYGIDRTNAARVQAENAAREQRQASPVRDNRADAARPAFTGPRAYPGGGDGGGALGPWTLILLLPLIRFAWRRGGQ